jgi:ABC-type enterochelin transport system ATPase subunit
MIRTANAKLRMLAGPNGSGKTTLFNYLRKAFTFPFGYCFNPDDVDAELVRHRRVFLGPFGVEIENRAGSLAAGGRFPHLLGRETREERLGF